MFHAVRKRRPERWTTVHHCFVFFRIGIGQILEITAVESVDERGCRKVICRMRELVFNVILRSAETNDPDALAVNAQ